MKLITFNICIIFNEILFIFFNFYFLNNKRNAFKTMTIVSRNIIVFKLGNYYHTLYFANLCHTHRI